MVLGVRAWRNGTPHKYLPVDGYCSIERRGEKMPIVTPVAEPMISLVRVFDLGIYSMHEIKPPDSDSTPPLNCT
jgi:hypothetical protein